MHWPTAARCGQIPIRRTWACASRFARANTYAFVANQEEDDIENSSPDDQDEVDPFWTELVDLMVRKGKGKGKNKINRVNCHDVGVQTDLDANQIFCEIDNALKHPTTVSAEAAAAAPLLAPAAAVSHQRAFDADEHLRELRMRCENMPTSTAALAVEPPTSARSSGTSQPPPMAPLASQRLRICTSASPRRESSRSRDVYCNVKSVASRRRWGSSSSGGE